MIFHCLIVDDEPIAREVISDYLAQIPSLENAGECSTALEALEILKSQEIDVLFLDIKLPKMSGLSFLKSLINAPKIIITSAYKEYALEGYELAVSDYLLKPVSFERFLKAVNKVTRQLELERAHKPLTPDDKQSAGSFHDALIIKSDKKILKVDLKEICYMEAYGNYVKVKTEDKTYLSNKSLQQLSENLQDKGFLRVHRSYLVPYSKIKGVTGNQLLLEDKKLPIGQQYKKALMEWLDHS